MPSIATQRKVDLWNAMRLHETHPSDAVVAVKGALVAGSNPNDGYGTWVPLGWAIRHGAYDMAVALIENGADINISENGKPLMGLCLLSKAMEPLADVFIARGVRPTPAILRIAAKQGNVQIVQWALDAGIDPNTLGRDPALKLWPAKLPLPERLLQASFREKLAGKTGVQLVELIARRKNLVMLQYLITRGDASQGLRQLLLRLTIQARWKAGLALLVEQNYCPPAQDAAPPTPIAACGNWVSAGKNPQPGLRVLAHLLSHGYALNASYRPAPGDQGLVDVDAFSLLRDTHPAALPALLDFLLRAGLQPIFTTAKAADTLAHALIRCNAWQLLGTLPQLFPGLEWDHQSAPGLLATWATFHNPDRARFDTPCLPPEESLAIVMALPGFDLHRRNAQGESGLRAFLQRPSGTKFSKITGVLLGSGLDPFTVDKQGVNDLAYARTRRLPPGARETFEAQAMQQCTQQASGSASSRRL